MGYFCRGVRRWMFAAIFCLTIAYHVLHSNRKNILQTVAYQLPFVSAPRELISVEQVNSIADQIHEHDDLGGDAGQGLLAAEAPSSLQEAATQKIASDISAIQFTGFEESNQLSIKTSSLTKPVPSTSGSSSLVQDAHTFSSADDFLSHFPSLPEVYNLTVEEAMQTCQWTTKELSHFQYGEDAPWVINHHLEIVIALQREQWQRFIQNDLISWTSVQNKFSGRGIIVVAGHPKSIKRLKVTLRSLLQLNSTVPVEVHYFGDEIDEATQADLLSLYHHPNTTGTQLYFNDLASPDQLLKSSYNEEVHVNYNLKTAALVNSRFAEPLLLDSDNIPAIDPAILWESATYEEYGSVFWPDLARTRGEHPAWAITNTPCRKDEYELETGQVLVDKRRYFYHLQLAAFWGEQPYWHDVLLGDKDLFRFAWHALKTQFGTPGKWITSVGFMAETDVQAEVLPAYCGHTFAQHHPDFKSGMEKQMGTDSGIAFFHGGTLKALSAPMLTRLRQHNGGVFTHYKRSRYDEDWGAIEYDVGLRYWNAAYYYAKYEDPILGGDEDFDKDGVPISLEDVHASALTDEDTDHADVLCTDWGEVEARPLGMIGESSIEQRFEDAGGYWMIEDGYRWGRSGA